MVTSSQIATRTGAEQMPVTCSVQHTISQSTPHTKHWRCLALVHTHQRLCQQRRLTLTVRHTCMLVATHQRLGQGEGHLAVISVGPRLVLDRKLVGPSNHVTKPARVLSCNALPVKPFYGGPCRSRAEQ